MKLLQLLNLFFVCSVLFRFLGGVRDEQRHSWISPVNLHHWPCSWPATPPSGWGRGGDGRGPGTRPFIIFNPQWRHGEDPAGRPARVEPQQLVLRQVGVGQSLQKKNFQGKSITSCCGCTSLFANRATLEVTCWSLNSMMLVELHSV